MTNPTPLGWGRTRPKLALAAHFTKFLAKAESVLRISPQPKGMGLVILYNLSINAYFEKLCGKCRLLEQTDFVT